MNFLKFIFLLALSGGVIDSRAQSFDSLSPTTAPGSGWEQISEGNNLSVYVFENDGSIYTFQAIGTLRAPIDKLLAVLRDVESAPRWNPDIKYKITLKNISDVEAITYNLNEFSWPVSNRDFVLHNLLSLDRENRFLMVRVKSTTFHSHPPFGDNVRGDVRFATLYLRPAKDSSTDVRLLVNVDPRGSIPKWLVNWIQEQWPRNYLVSLEQEANRTTLELNPGIRSLLKQLDVLLKQPKDL